VKAILLIPLLMLSACVEGDEKARAEKARQQAIEREVEARVAARVNESPEERLSVVRIAVYGSLAAGGLVALHVLGAPRPGEPSGTLPPRSGGRVLDLPRHENPPSH
jgi:hypothetical protein